MERTETVDVGDDPDLVVQFKAAETRHWTDRELDELSRQGADYPRRTEVARACYEVESAVVDEAVDSILDAYPMEGKHDYSGEKCVRDVTNVSTYAIHAMLIGNEQWFKNKILYWLKTILQSFDFPGRTVPKETMLFGDSSSTDKINSLPAKSQSIYETYYLVEKNYEKQLSEEDFSVVSPYLSMIKDVLSGD